MWIFVFGFMFGIITGLISKKALYIEIIYKGENKNEHTQSNGNDKRD